MSEKLKDEYYTRYVIGENGKFRELKVSKKEATRDIKRLLKRDKDFLEIMAKM